MTAADLDHLLAKVVAQHHAWEARFPAFATDASVAVDPAAMRAAVHELTGRLHAENYPHFHPLYAAQMLKAPHPAAVIGYLAAMLVNPNNHALDGGRATAALEKEAVGALARAFGFADERFLGHLTSSGTIANLEALWVARELRPDGIVVLSSDAHYTHARACDLLRVERALVPASASGQMDVAALEALCSTRKVATVVVTLGTTGLGALDPLGEILALRDRFGFRVHADMAYGGYFKLLADDAAFEAFQRTAEVDSLVVDPHKHGLQPYGCGAVLFRDGNVARLYAHDSPYTYFSSPDHHPGETTFECSRAGAAAAALWLTLKVLPLDTRAGMRAVVARCRESAVRFANAIAAHDRFALLVPPALDIVTYFPIEATTSAITARTKHVFAAGEASRTDPIFVATLKVDAARFAELHPNITIDSSEVTVLRSCLMRPEQASWTDRLMHALEAALDAPSG